MDTFAPLLGEPLPVELMNTIWADRQGVHDSLADQIEAMAWLSAIAFRVGLPIEEDLVGATREQRLQLTKALVQLRDALRRLAAEATKDNGRDATSSVADTRAALDVVNQAAAAAPRWLAVELTDGSDLRRFTRSTQGASMAAISQIADAAVTMLTGPERESLRACQAPGCVLYFVKQHPRREWCSPACGNRVRVARHYHRHVQEHP